MVTTAKAKATAKTARKTLATKATAPNRGRGKQASPVIRALQRYSHPDSTPVLVSNLVVMESSREDREHDAIQRFAHQVIVYQQTLGFIQKYILPEMFESKDVKEAEAESVESDDVDDDESEDDEAPEDNTPAPATPPADIQMTAAESLKILPHTSVKQLNALSATLGYIQSEILSKFMIDDDNEDYMDDRKPMFRSIKKCVKVLDHALFKYLPKTLNKKDSRMHIRAWKTFLDEFRDVDIVSQYNFQLGDSDAYKVDNTVDTYFRALMPAPKLASVPPQLSPSSN